MTMSELLVAHSVTKRFGEVTALDDLSLTVHQGEMVSLLGPSGCGKTTLLRVMAGFVDPDQGTITIDGSVMNDVPTEKRNLGMVFQSYSLWPHMTVARNVGFGLECRGAPRQEIGERVEKVLDLVDLGDLVDRYPRQLSGGQQQRVALARALVYEPAILLLDEPLSALDRKLRERMQRDLRALQQKLSITAVFVTHDQEEALILSDRIAVMSQGAIVQMGRPREVYEHPQSPFVADFVGRTTRFEATVTSCRDHEVEIATRSGLKLGGYTPVVRSSGDRVNAVIRPEMISILIDDPEHDGHEATIEEVSYVGPVTYFACRLAQGDPVIVARMNSETGVRSPCTGQTLLAPLAVREPRRHIARRGFDRPGRRSSTDLPSGPLPSPSCPA